jgi:hypothetical protein
MGDQFILCSCVDQRLSVMVEHQYVFGNPTSLLAPCACADSCWEDYRVRPACLRIDLKQQAVKIRA